MNITIETVMSANPCSDYTREHVESLFAGRAEMSPREVAELEIPVEDRIWALIHVAMDDRQRSELACDCAERALNRERAAGREPDARSWAAVEVARRYARGGATSDELDAAWDAAWDAARAARDAAWAAAWAAAWTVDAAWDAAWDAARAAACAAWDAASDAAWAAWDAEREWQIARAVEILEGV